MNRPRDLRAIAVTFALVSVWGLAVSTARGQTNPVPWVNEPLVPSSIMPGSPGFMLTVNGTGFVSGSVVNWNGVSLSTQFVSSERLTATVSAADIAVSGLSRGRQSSSRRRNLQHHGF